MKKTIVLCTHNRPIQSRTLAAINELVALGAQFLDHAGAPSDVTLARNLGLTAVSKGLRTYPQFDVALLVDDDMVFTPADARLLVAQARFGVAVSAMYATELGMLAATRLQTPTGDRWAVGLGFIAIPAKLLLELEDASEHFELGGSQTAFTSSGAHGGRYWSEDYTLCRRLGGVVLLPVPVGHLKTVALYPDAATVEAVLNGAVHANALPAADGLPDVDTRSCQVASCRVCLPGD